VTRHDCDVTVDLRDVPTVLLPGTGSDANYLERAFSPALRDAGADLRAHDPQPGRLIDGYWAACDEAAREHAIAVGGVSIGAAVAVRWALTNPDRCLAVLAALPAWTGWPGDAPAAISARHTAQILRRDGLSATTSQMRASSPAWLAAELTRSWLRQWPDLPAAMEEAAAYAGPTLAELQQLNVPMSVVAAVDDPIHPLDVATEWVTAAPRAALRTVSLGDFGPNPPILGRLSLAALPEAG
jgi:pimeloyl-ACP methyl ester carboxylesterase